MKSNQKREKNKQFYFKIKSHFFSAQFSIFFCKCHQTSESFMEWKCMIAQLHVAFRYMCESWSLCVYHFMHYSFIYSFKKVPVDRRKVSHFQTFFINFTCLVTTRFIHQFLAFQSCLTFLWLCVLNLFLAQLFRNNLLRIKY